MRLRPEFKLSQNEKQLLRHINEFRRVELKVQAAFERKYPEDWQRINSLMDRFGNILKKDGLVPFRLCHSYLAQWDLSAVRALKDTYNFVRPIVAAESKAEKKNRIEKFAWMSSLHLNDFRLMLNGNFNLIPAHSGVVRDIKDSKGVVKDIRVEAVETQDIGSHLWLMVANFGRKIARFPKRLKLCISSCQLLFWDDFTKAGSSKICKKPNCKKSRNAALSRKSYKHRKKTKSKPAPYGAKPKRRKVNEQKTKND